MEGTVWNIDIGVLKKSSNFSVPYGVLYRGEGNILKRGTVVFKLNLLGMEWQRFLKEAFFFF
jgi:hypothetical protein